MMKSKGWQTLAHSQIQLVTWFGTARELRVVSTLLNNYKDQKKKKKKNTKTQVIFGHKAKGRYSSAIYIYKKNIGQKRQKL